MSDYVTVEQDGWTTTSNQDTEAQIKDSTQKTIEPPKPEPAAAVEEHEDAADEVVPANETAEQKSARQEKARKYKPIQPRIDQLTRERKEAQAERDAIRAELERERAGRQAPAPSTSQVHQQQDDDVEPTEDDPKFKTYGEYVKEAAKWAIRQERRAEVQSQAEAINRQKVHEVVSSFSASIKAARDEDPSFSERQSEYVAQLTPSIELPPGVRPTRENILADFIIHSPEAAKLTLKENEAELRRILTLHPMRFGAELGKLEYRLSTGTPTASVPQPAVSKARPPARSVTGGPPANTDTSGDIDLDTFVKRSRKN